MARRLVHSRQIRDLSLSQPSGPADALVSRPRHGHQPPKYLRRPVRSLYHPRRVRRSTESARGAGTKFRWRSAIAFCGATARWTIRSQTVPARRGCPKFSATPCWSTERSLRFWTSSRARYRFRLLNASNGRFFHLSLSNDQEFHLIGTDQGLLPAPTRIASFVLAPGERVDLVIDFKDHAGEQIVLRSDAFELMQFRVSRARVSDESSLALEHCVPVPKIPESSAVQTRDAHHRRVHEPRAANPC